MQPLHRPDNTFGTWEEIDQAAAIAAAATSDSESSSSKGADVRQFFVQDQAPTAATSPSRGRAALTEAASAAAVTLNADAERAPECDPSCHTQCCGVEFDLKKSSWIQCEKRSTFASKVHKRGVICVSARDITKVTKCASCSNLAHAYCLILQVTGAVRQASPLESWTCNSCQKQNQSLDASIAKKEPVSSAYHTLQTKEEIVKQLSDANWKCRSSHTKDGRMYFHCALGTCNVKISAKNQSDDTEGGEWAIKNLPSSHACGGGSGTKPVFSVARTQNILSSAVFQDIQRLACSACFKSDAIQKFIRTTHSVNVHVKLIANIGYRARQKLFGGSGDLEELLKQQKVAD